MYNSPGKKSTNLKVLGSFQVEKLNTDNTVFKREIQHIFIGLYTILDVYRGTLTLCKFFYLFISEASMLI